MTHPATAKTRHAVATVAELPPGARKIVQVPASGQGMQLGVFNVDGRLVAYRNLCPHAGAPVCEGRITERIALSSVGEDKPAHVGKILRCPWHGWEFDLLDGRHLVNGETLPADAPSQNLEAFDVETSGDTVWVLI